MKSPHDKSRSVPQHFYSLDALRGGAALGVVFWHWQHFFYHGTEVAQFDREQQPLYSFFKFFYTDGWRAVDLFFCLSGFIFYWLYSEKVRTHSTSLKEFFVLRFSRLYPLHLATLLVVAAGQQLMLWRHGTYFIYPNNDFFHFALQLMFASSWGLEHGFSFNGPIWSVSVEILLYAIFFVTCLLNFRRWWQLALFVFCGYLLMEFGHDHAPLGRGMFSFFVGGISFHIFSHVLRRSPSRITLQCLGMFTGLMWVLVPLNNYHNNIVYHIYRTYLWNVSLNLHGKDIGGFILRTLTSFSYELLLFPLTIITLALWETKRGTIAKRLAFLGQISYSSYLLHFPLQMMFAGIALTFAVPNTFFYTPLALFLFFIVLIPLSLCSYRFFERPCQSFIRKLVFRRAQAGNQYS